MVGLGNLSVCLSIWLIKPQLLIFPGEDDLLYVMEQVIDIAAGWRPLGLTLGLRRAELDTISSRHHTDPTECLREMILSWLKQRYNTSKFGWPSWRLLCHAIHKPAGGNDPVLARKIAERVNTYRCSVLDC